MKQITMLAGQETPNCYFQHILLLLHFL
uniref:Uncharacterized protein n=1 Tax=Wuchereria bancrofti TaxID=6293 RepID=A0AAF5PYV1_WUCBA